MWPFASGSTWVSPAIGRMGSIGSSSASSRLGNSRQPGGERDRGRSGAEGPPSGVTRRSVRRVDRGAPRLEAKADSDASLANSTTVPPGTATAAGHVERRWAPRPPLGTSTATAPCHSRATLLAAHQPPPAPSLPDHASSRCPHPIAGYDCSLIPPGRRSVCPAGRYRAPAGDPRPAQRKASDHEAGNPS